MTSANLHNEASGWLNRQDQPPPTLWTSQIRGRAESALDCETSVSLACHLNPIFEMAEDWAVLIQSLKKQYFSLVFKEGQLTLFNDVTGTNLCTCASLGIEFATLKDRLGKPSVRAPSGRFISKKCRS